MTSLIITEKTQKKDLVLFENDHIALPNKLIAPADKKQEVKNCYTQIYNWHDQEGRKASKQDFPNDHAATLYFEALPLLQAPDKASIRHMLVVADSVQKGVLNWSARKEANGRSLFEWAQTIKQIAQAYGAETIRDYKLRAADRKVHFLDAARAYYLKNIPRLAEVFNLRLDQKNIGGLTVLMETNAMYNRDVVVNPNLLGFDEIVEPEALVNLAIDRKIDIQRVRIERDHSVWVKFKNNTSEALEFVIPRGQLFENELCGFKYQNLMLLKEIRATVKPHGTKDVSGLGSCINYAYQSPIGTRAKLAIFKYDRKGEAYESQREVWSSMQEQASGYRSWKQSVKYAFNFNSAWHQLNRTKQKVIIGVGITGAILAASMIFSAMM